MPCGCSCAFNKTVCYLILSRQFPASLRMHGFRMSTKTPPIYKKAGG
jgi:hypothetical protein